MMINIIFIGAVALFFSAWCAILGKSWIRTAWRFSKPQDLERKPGKTCYGGFGIGNIECVGRFAFYEYYLKLSVPWPLLFPIYIPYSAIRVDTGPPGIFFDVNYYTLFAADFSMRMRIARRAAAKELAKRLSVTKVQESEA